MWHIVLVFLFVYIVLLTCLFTYLFTCRLVKLTSPFLNVVTIIGAIVFYVDVILFGIDENIASFSTVDALCQVCMYKQTDTCVQTDRHVCIHDWE